MDVKFAFLNRLLEEKVYVEQALGYMVTGHEDKVLIFKKALCGLKQAPKAWNSIINKYFRENNLIKCQYDSLYQRQSIEAF